MNHTVPTPNERLKYIVKIFYVYSIIEGDFMSE